MAESNAQINIPSDFTGTDLLRFPELDNHLEIVAKRRALQTELDIRKMSYHYFAMGYRIGELIMLVNHGSPFFGLDHIEVDPRILRRRLRYRRFFPYTLPGMAS